MKGGAAGHTAPGGQAGQSGSGGPSFLVSLGCAALAEAILVAALVLAMNRQPPPPQAERTPLRVLIQAPPAPPKPVQPPPAPPPPVPQTPPLPPPPLPPPPVQPPRPVPVARPPVPTRHPAPVRDSHRVRHQEIPPPDITPPQQSAPPEPSPAPRPAPQAPSLPSPGEIASFESVVRRAVQAALIYPGSAQAAHERGVAHVRFDYLDGHVSNAAISRSTGYPMLDAAALQTVRNAHYPATPGRFAGRLLHMDVDVIFQASDEADSPD